MSEKEAEEFFNSLGDKFAYCNVEWLVKWKDLGYEYATWELETSSFLCTPEAKDLKRNYESRHEDARRGFDPAKINKVYLWEQLSTLTDSPLLNWIRITHITCTCWSAACMHFCGCPPHKNNDVCKFLINYWLLFIVMSYLHVILLYKFDQLWPVDYQKLKLYNWFSINFESIPMIFCAVC